MPSEMFGLWDVEGEPVVIRPSKDGGMSVRAIGEASGVERPFPVGSVLRNGSKVSPERFAELFPKAAALVAQ